MSNLAASSTLTPRKTAIENAAASGTVASLYISTKSSQSSSIILPRTLRGIRRLLKSNYLYMLLVFVPIGVTSGLLDLSPIAVFVFNMLAIIPLAMLLNFATEELSANAGQTVGALLNATFGNAVEMIVSTVALLRGEIRLVQASILGAILSNILLGLGCCLFIGGYRVDCHFNATAASTMASLMAVSSASLMIPAALNVAYDTHATPDSESSILLLSRGTAIILLILYVMYLYFQLKTHTRFFEETPCTILETPLEFTGTIGAATTMNPEKPNGEHPLPAPPPAPSVHGHASNRILSPPLAIASLFGISLTIALCAEFLLGTISSIVAILGINRTFIGLIILPLLGNVAEYMSAMLAASRGKMDLAIGVALGSTMQIALLVTPTLVLVGWVVGQPMTLSFEPFGAVVFFLSVIVVTGLIQDGESNYLEGAMLVGTYLIIAIAFFVYPDKAP